MIPPAKINSFIVRIWCETETRPKGPVLVRGSVEHVQSRKKEYFQGVEALLKFIEAEMPSPRKPKLRQTEGSRKREKESGEG